MYKEDETIGFTKRSTKRRRKKENPDCECPVRPHHKSNVVSLERDSVNPIIVPLERDIDRPDASADRNDEKRKKCIEDAENYERKIQNLTKRYCANVPIYSKFSPTLYWLMSMEI